MAKGMFGIKDAMYDNRENTGSNGNSQKKQEEQKPANVNRYDITMDISGLKFSSNDNSTRIEYREVSDYWNANFPVRTITVEVPYNDVQKILCSQEKSNSNGIKVYDLNLIVTAKDANAFKNKAFNDGAFKGVLIENDTSDSFSNTVNPDSRAITREQGEMRVPLTFILYRENELRFSQNLKINAVMSNPSLSGIFMWGLNKSNPALKCCASKFETNPSMGLMIIPSMSFVDLLSLLDYEVGFFKTKPIQFIEHNVFFFLNRENNVNVTNEKLSYSLMIDVSRNADTPYSKYVKKITDQDFKMSISSSEIKVSVSNANSFSNSVKWIYPNGKTKSQENSFSRNTNIIKKITNVDPVLKLQSLVYEFVDINVSENSLNFITPLTKIKLLDSMGKPREYRISRSELSLISGYSSNVKIRGFRVLE